MRILAAINTALLAALLIVAGLILRHLTAPEVYSYMIVAPDDTQFDAEMNKLGAFGFEVVSARRAVGGDEKKPAYEMILRKKGAAPIPSRASK